MIGAAIGELSIGEALEFPRKKAGHTKYKGKYIPLEEDKYELLPMRKTNMRKLLFLIDFD